MNEQEVSMTRSFPSRANSRPLVVIASDRVQQYGHQAHMILHGYVDAVVHVSGALPLALPADSEAVDLPSLIANVDGVVLTGSPSDVSPQCYGGTASSGDSLLDPQRDATILPLLTKLVEAGIPVLGICRGFQEMNVAWGGTLNSAVHERHGAIDHREGDHSRPIQEWYQDSHWIEIAPGGVLSELYPFRRAVVNSLHHQGLEKLGKGLKVEATAPDGLIEAFSVERASSFALAVQWHPEMRVRDDGLSREIFTVFGHACRRRLQTRLAEKQAFTYQINREST
jgi:putative glutamine amidotransferase